MYNISNRRYTGSKYKLLDWLEQLILENCEGDVFFDVFAGTGTVSDRMNKYYKKVIMNDFLYSNEIIYKAFYKKERYRESVIKKYNNIFQSLDAKRLKPNYFSKNYGDKFFSEKDALIIGEIREQIEKDKDKLFNKEYNILIASLLYSMDKIANTVGHYEAYRKNITIEDKFAFNLINPVNLSCDIDIYREDANLLVRKVKADIAFIDPPYNSRQYSRFYHVLENTVKWDKPQLAGTALKPPVENMSDYCRSNADKVFEDLIMNIDVNYIVVTYNNTYNSKSSSSKNKITLEEINEILLKRGKTDVFEKNHQCFNAGKTDFDDHKEYVFITKVGR